MDANLRLAWTQIVTADDYEQHMAGIGQAQAAATLNRQIIEAAKPPDGSHVVIAGAGTGQMFDFLDPALFRSFRLTCTDLNRSFLARLEERLAEHALRATILVDDIEQTALEPGPALLLATLLLEHIDWRRGVEVFAELRPTACGIIIQENPQGMTSAVTPGRSTPPSVAKAVETAHAKLVPLDELLAAFEERGYQRQVSYAEHAADGKRLIAVLFFRDHSYQRKTAR